MVIKLGLAGIEGFELMIEHLGDSTFVQYLFKLFEFNLVLRRCTFRVIGIVIGHHQITAFNVAYQICECIKSRIATIVAHIFLLGFEGSTIQLRLFPLHQILIDMVEATVLTRIIGRIEISQININSSCQTVRIFLMNFNAIITLYINHSQLKWRLCR